MTKRSHKILFITVLLTVDLALAGVTYAYLTSAPEALVNTFQPGKLSVSIPEDFDPTPEGDTAKKVVAIKNASEDNVPAYIRAAIVPTYREKQENGTYLTRMCDVSVNGSIMTLTTPRGIEVKVNLTNMGDKWFYCEADGFFYHVAEVEGGGVTAQLMDKVTCTDLTFNWDNLQIEVLADAISAGGVVPEEISSIWPNVKISDGGLAPKNP